jgi:hypothetical protein
VCLLHGYDMNRLLRHSFAMTLLAGLFAPFGAATAADSPGTFHVFDDAGIFSTDGKKQATKKLEGQKFDRGLHVTVDTYKEMPADWKKKFDAATDKAKVVKDWAIAAAQAQRAKGPFVLICMKPGYTVVIADEETVKRGFTKSEEDEVRKIFDTALRDAAKLDPDKKTEVRDAALLKATEYIIKSLKGTKVP